MASWLDTLYENNWHELPEIDVHKVERAAARQAVAHAQAMKLSRDSLAYLHCAQAFYAGYMDQVHDVMWQLQRGTLPPEALEEIRRKQRG